MKKITFSLILIFSGLVVFGANQVASWETLPTNAVVLIINGKDVTKADFSAQAKLWAALFACCGKNMTAAKACEAVEKNKNKLVDSYIFLRMVNGMTKVGNDTFIGSGSVLYNCIEVPNDSIIPAGTIVRK